MIKIFICFQDIESPRKLGLGSYLQREEKMVLSCSLSLKGNERIAIMDEVENGHGLYHEEETQAPSRQRRAVQSRQAGVNQLDDVQNRFGVVLKSLTPSLGCKVLPSCGCLTLHREEHLCSVYVSSHLWTVARQI